MDATTAVPSANLPTWDDALQQHAAPSPDQSLPTWSDALSKQQQDQPSAFGLAIDALKPLPPFFSNQDVVDHDKAVDQFLKNTGVGRTMNAFGQNFADSFNAGGSLGLRLETEQELRKLGIFNDYAAGEANLGKAFTQALVAPSAAFLDGTVRAFGASFEGVGEAVKQGGKELGLPEAGEGLGQLVEHPEALFGSGVHLPEFSPVIDRARAEISTLLPRAQSAAVIGEGEAGYFGTAETTPEQSAVRNQAAQSLPEATAPVEADQPDIHQVARNLAPDVFKEYDDLSTKKDILRQQISDLSEQRQSEAEASSPHAEEMADLQAKLEDANVRKSKIYQARLDELLPEHESFVQDAIASDTPEMAAAREELQKADYRMRDLAPDVSKAYRDAQEFLPEEAATLEAPPQVQTDEPKTEPEQQPQTFGTDQTAQGPSIEQKRASIVDDVTKKLIAAGRPEEEAQAAAAIVAEHYQARSERFGGTNGTAEEMYARDGAEIRAGKERAPRARELTQPGRELDQSARGKIKLATDDAKATISLFKSANASTFIHETGHHFLEEMMRDAVDEKAPQGLKDDAAAVRKWLGASETGDIETRQHEKFARGFERYLMEGTAPSKTLAGVFAKFKQWLTNIYQTVNRLKSPITDDIRDVFDRLLSSKPEKTIIAPDHEPGKMLADIHEADAQHTAPEHAAEVRDNIRSEVNSTAKLHEPDIHDALKTEESAARAGNISAPASGTQESGSSAGPLSGEGIPLTEPATVNAGGSAARAEGAGASKKPNVASSVYTKVPKEPTRLAEWVRKNGGLTDEGGDIRSSIGGAKMRPGLISKNGNSADYLALRAMEDGYFPEKVGERPTANEFLGKLTDDLQGKAQYSERDSDAVSAYRDALAHNSEADRLSNELGIDKAGKTHDQFWDEVAERMSVEKQAHEADELAKAHAADLEEAERKEKEWLESRGEAWEPVEEKSRTLEDLENERRQENLARGTQQSAGGTESAGPAPADTGSVQAGGGQGGSSAEPAGRASTQEAGRVTGGGSGSGAKQPDSPNSTFGKPATALVDKAGNIRLDNLNTPEDINEVLRETAKDNDGFTGARRGVISASEQLDLADALGMKASDLNMRKIGEAFSAEKIIAARKLLIQSATEVRDLMAKAAMGTDADVMAYAEAKARHMMIQEQVSGVTAEAGRALGAFRALEGSEQTKALGDFLKDTTGKTLFQLKQEAQLGLALDTPQKISKFINDSKKPSFGDQILEYWVNGLISGPATHTTYMMGNMLSALWKAIPETGVAALIGKAREAFGKEGGGVRLGEVGAQLKSAVKELPTALSAAGKALKSGVTTLLPGEEERVMPFQDGSATATPGRVGNAPATWKELGSDVFGALKGMRDAFIATGDLIKSGGTEDSAAVGLKRSPLGSIPDLSVRGVTVPVGSVIRAPARAIAAIHSFFRTVNYSMEKSALAYRAASDEGLEGDNFSARVGDIVTNPSEELMQQARGTATDLTLMGQGGAFTQAISRLTNVSVNLPGFGETKLLKFIDPFVHIGSNVIEQSVLRRTPVGLLSPDIRADLAGANGATARDLAQARMLVGTALGITAGGLASEGLISGSGPSDPKEAAAWRMLGGNQPHSIKVGAVWYDTHRLGPLGMLMGIAADMHDVAHAMSTEDATKVASMMVHSVTQNILDESFMRGPSELIKALSDSDRYGDAYIRNMVSSFVPFSVGMSQITRATDPYSRQARTVMDAIKAKLPWESQTLFPRRDIWGEPIANKEALGAAGFSAIYESRVNKDPVNQAMLNLGVFPAQPERKIRGIALTDQQYDDFSRLSGRMAKTRLNAIVPVSGFSSLPVSSQIEVIKKTIETSRETARSVIMMQNPGIIKQATDAKLQALKPTIH